ncbi:MAG: hypothetical protein ACOCP4_05470 [Candidatus Woesearchaeota archaeon]
MKLKVNKADEDMTLSMITNESEEEIEFDYVSFVKSLIKLKEEDKPIDINLEFSENIQPDEKEPLIKIIKDIENVFKESVNDPEDDKSSNDS